MNWAVPNEADVQASQPQASQQARIPREDEDSGRSGHSFASPEEGPRPSCGGGGEQVGAQASGPGEGLSRAVRIRHTNDIRALLDRGKRKRTRLVDVFLAPSPVPFSRLGVIVPKHGRTIVERNGLRRRIREIGRRGVLPDAARRGLAVDVLLRARGEAYGAGFTALEVGIREAVEALWSDAS